jgi:FAD/FMN-containing dehydrogenase
MDHIIGFDPIQGRFECEAGTRMADILTVSAVRGWTLPVIPACPHVTVGGAIANDIHDDGHLQHGNLGRHLLGLELLRSNGQRLWLEPGLRNHQRLLTATIGGLGLTGLITRVRLQLAPSSGTAAIIETHRFRNLNELWPMLGDHITRWPHLCVSLDCLARRPRLGQGILYLAQPAPECFPATESWLPRRCTDYPLSAAALHRGARHSRRRWLYRIRGGLSRKVSRYRIPLEHWLFSPPRTAAFAMPQSEQGFTWVPYHARLPSAAAQETVAEILQRVANSGQQVMAGTLEVFGSSPPSGILSFAREGLGFSFRIRSEGDSSQRLLQDLDEIVLAVGGNLHAGQDRRMSRTAFRRAYPRWEEFATEVDPGFSSEFWRRMQP